MAERSGQWREYARVGLACIRLFNGALGLFAPGVLARRLGGDPDTNPGFTYVSRMFGVRTILIAAELLLPDPEERARSVRVAPLIHLSDVAAAVVAGRRGQLPRRAAAVATAISATNVALSLLAQPPRT